MLSDLTSSIYSHWLSILASAAFFSMIAAHPVAGHRSQDPSKSKPDDQQTLRIDTALVTLSVGVESKKKIPIANLAQENFAVYEDGRIQTIAFFGREDEPISFGLLLDHSRSMGETGKLEMARAAAISFLRAGNTQNEAFLLSFNESATMVADFTSDFPKIESKLAQIQAGGGTALYDAIIESLDKLSQAKRRRRALVVITDGHDQHSKHSLDDLIRRAQQSDAQIYTIGFFSPVEIEAYRTESEKVMLSDGRKVDNPRFVFKTLAEETGSESFFPKSAAELDKTISQIAASLRRQYTIAYYPSDPDNYDRYRRISVKLIGEAGNQARVQTRRGYRLPENPGRSAAAETASSKPDEAQNIIMVVAPGTKSARVGDLAPPVYQEKFDNPSSDWPQNEKSSIKKGKYYLTGQTVIPVSTFVYSDFEASVVAEAIGGARGAGLRSVGRVYDAGVLTASGLSFRINESGYYTLLVAPYPSGKEGVYKLLKVSGGVQTDLINWRKDSAVTFRNSIKVRCVGSKIEIFINTLRVNVFNDEDHKEGRINLVVSDGEASFDDLSIKKLP
jgi:VWFA-related protein